MLPSATIDTIRRAATPDGEEQRSLMSRVRARLEQMILNGEVKAGDHINENALAAEFAVSRAPIREATRALAEAGLVTVIRNRGAFVREVSLEDVLHVYDVRAGLARVAGRLAALRATEVQVDALRGLWQRMEEARLARDSDRYYEVNRSFHADIMEISANPRLIDFHETTEAEVFLFLRRGVTGSARLDVSNRQHKQVIDAIAAGDELGAARAFENHVIAGKQRMLDTLGWRTGR